MTDKRLAVLLAAGYAELAVAMLKAGDRLHRQAGCNGRVNCQAPEHLSVCLTQRKKEERDARNARSDQRGA